ncbi:MAG: hypothetical protein ABEK42_04390 [Thiohalorhabdaceae bacterium]
MLGRIDGWAPLAAGLLLAAVLAPTTALAHGEEGDHVASFQDHLDDYEADVEKLASRLDKLVERYRREGGANVAEFVAAWEEVKYHAAVENVATPLYPPIWQGISGLRQAVKDDADAATVRAKADQVVAALREGLGALKLKANMRETGGKSAESGGEESGPAAAFDRIRDHLDQAVAAYDNGKSDKAKALVRDAYFNNFEGLEGRLIEQDPALVTRLEEAFNAGLLGRINDGAPTGEVEAMVESMKEELAQAEALLEGAGEEDSEVF